MHKLNVHIYLKPLNSVVFNLNCAVCPFRFVYHNFLITTKKRVRLKHKHIHFFEVTDAQRYDFGKMLINIFEYDFIDAYNVYSPKYTFIFYIIVLGF